MSERQEDQRTIERLRRENLERATRMTEIDVPDWVVPVGQAGTMPELKPCPFCGGEAERIDFGPGDAENAGGSCIACKRCQSSGPVEFGYKENFISNWNRRAAALSQNAVREYVTELRAQADQKMVVAGACVHDGDRAHYKSAAQLLRRVADKLESLLSAASGEGVGK